MSPAAGLGILNLYKGKDPQLDWCESPSQLPKSESIQARPQLTLVMLSRKQLLGWDSGGARKPLVYSMHTYQTSVYRHNVMLLLFKELDKVYFHPASNLDYSMSQLSD
jgi:hypothetical protein